LFSQLPSPPATSTLSLHDALPISTPVHRSLYRVPGSTGSSPCCTRARWRCNRLPPQSAVPSLMPLRNNRSPAAILWLPWSKLTRSEEHTSELQSRFDLVCRLLLEK